MGLIHHHEDEVSGIEVQGASDREGISFSDCFLRTRIKSAGSQAVFGNMIYN
jgi:hypothetical protein